MPAPGLIMPGDRKAARLWVHRGATLRFGPCAARIPG
jgi:hypothetical protein